MTGTATDACSVSSVGVREFTATYGLDEEIAKENARGKKADEKRNTWIRVGDALKSRTKHITNKLAQ